MVRRAWAMAWGTRRMVRVHLKVGPSIEGYFVTKKGGMVIVELPKVWLPEATEADPLRDASAVEIPADNFAFMEVLMHPEARR